MDGSDRTRRPFPARPGHRRRHTGTTAAYDATAPPVLGIEVVDAGTVVLVRVWGELDLATVPQLAAILHPLRHRPCELDLAQVPFMDSTGLTALLTHHHCAQSAGGSLRVVDFTPAIGGLLALTGTSAILLAAPGHATP
jgi:anti-anti-sigma factor